VAAANGRHGNVAGRWRAQRRPCSLIQLSEKARSPREGVLAGNFLALVGIFSGNGSCSKQSETSCTNIRRGHRRSGPAYTSRPLPPPVAAQCSVGDDGETLQGAAMDEARRLALAVAMLAGLYADCPRANCRFRRTGRRDFRDCICGRR